MTEQKNVYSKIAKVILHDSTQKIAKDTRGYTADDVLAALRGAMGENNLVCIPSMPTYDNDWLNFTFKLVDADSGDSIECPWSQRIPEPNKMMTRDKCVGAASTYAMKYFLMRTFMLTSSDDPKIDPPSGNGNNQRQTTSNSQASNNNGNTPAPSKQQQPLVKDSRRTLDGKILEFQRIKRIGKEPGQKYTRWQAISDYDEVPGSVELTLFDNHLRDLDTMLGYESGMMEKRLSWNVIDVKGDLIFPKPLAICCKWDNKHKLIPAHIDQQPKALKDNPMILHNFMMEHAQLEPDDLEKALGSMIKDCDYDIKTARGSVLHWLNAPKTTDTNGNIITMPQQTKLIDTPVDPETVHASKSANQ